jgi:hypothetical protein
VSGVSAGTYRLKVEIRNPSAPADFPSEGLALHTVSNGQQRQLTAITVVAATMTGAQVRRRVLRVHHHLLTVCGCVASACDTNAVGSGRTRQAG